MIPEIAWKRDCPEILEKAQVELSLASFGNHGD